jgi:menaquinol-cytochrome c reductase iron-sulfur subunit
MEQENNRRSFLGWATCGLAAIFSAIIGVPIVCYAIDPRHRKGPKSNLKLVEGIKLDELPKNDPRQGVLRDVRLDGWTLYPNDVIGRVWVVQVGDRPDLSTIEKVKAFNASPAAAKEDYLIVFTTICPHLGCSVNSAGGAAGFACPCHNATFELNGKRATAANPALRGMDTLEWQIDETDPDFDRIKVKYENFTTSIAEKKTGG